MTDTMTTMELIKVDSMTAYSLEPGDLIEVDGDVVTIKNIVALNNGYEIEIVNDFGEEGGRVAFSIFIISSYGCSNFCFCKQPL